jgi:RimJ/RimL family protein N-acetyltransferase
MQLTRLLNIPYGGQCTIRIAMPSDAKGIVTCMNNVMKEGIYLLGDQYSYYEEFEAERIRTLREDLTLVAEYKNEVIGVLFLTRGRYIKNKHTAYLSIAIIDRFRKMGVGTSLIQTAIEWAKDKKIEKICLEVFSSNCAAINLYIKLGFIIEGRWKKQFKINNEYVDDILMSIFLQDQYETKS